MVTVIKNSEYYRQFEAQIAEEVDVVKYYAKKTVFWRKFSNEAYKKGGFWIIPSLFGGLVCEYYGTIGKRRAKNVMNECLNEMAALIKRLHENEKKG